MFKKLIQRIIEARLAQAKQMMRMYDDYRAFEQLNNLTDRELADIGITRYDIPKYLFGGLKDDKQTTNGNATTLS
jgi:uncharacterized protein YjiS (DUF1127 family)